MESTDWRSARLTKMPVLNKSLRATMAIDTDTFLLTEENKDANTEIET